tara:strand:- start:791 stop:1765 length:975 start_codon:yes stop_codon:yes gene_type:complete
MESMKHYQDYFDKHLKSYNQSKTPKNLYEPVQYVLEIGGKRLRPILTLITADCFGGNISDSLNAALAIEVFHNFTLIHDDIMDNAPLRRGKQTVHEKWNINTGILSGDAMLIMAYKLFESYPQSQSQELIKLFSKTALEVCEGQQYDIDFGNRFDVTTAEYLKMIEYKTAVLVASAMQMGAIIADASSEDQQKCFDFGRNLGIAFQLKDDYLDTFGDPKTFGKQIGGDIIENKKTYLFTKSIEMGSEATRNILKELYNQDLSNNEKKIFKVIEIFNETGAADANCIAIKKYTEKAFSSLKSLSIDSSKKNLLRDFGTQLMSRNI